MSVTKPLLLNETGEAIVEALQDLAGGKKIQQIIDTVGLSHNGIYRGKFLGVFASVADVEAFLSEHNVASGKFTDLYLGDYVTINDGTYNKDWEIVAFEHYLHKGDAGFTDHHAVLMPKVNLTTSYMNSTNTTDGSYPGSYMYSTIIPRINTALETVLGEHLLSHRVLLSTATNKWAWYTVKACLANEVEVYGSRIWGTSYDSGTSCKKLPLFNFRGVSDNRESYWLRDVYSSTDFANVGNIGNASNGSASHVSGVRPLICLG